MAQIKSFKGLRPRKDIAAKLAAPPYDVINSEEARSLAKRNPYSFLHITKPEIDLAEGIDLYSSTVYEKARANFGHFIKEGFLVQDATSCVYVYRQIMDNIAQVGLVACSSNQDYFDGIIKKHEFTRPVKENDRIAHMKSIRAHPGPVFLTYHRVETIDTIIKNAMESKQPEVDFTADDKVQHTLWVVDEESAIEQLVQQFKQNVPATYIADGHHRAASSAKVGEQLMKENPMHKGDEEYNFFLSVLFPDNQVRIIDYNRLVKDLNGLDNESFIKKIKESFVVEKKDNKIIKPSKLHEFGMYLDGSWYRLEAKSGTYDNNDPIAVLDVTVLSDHLLDPILGIKDQRTDNRIDFVGGIRGLKELQKRVDSGEMKVAFAIFPVTILQLINIADSGQVMPPKSTWFEPKLRSGLVVHKF